VLFILTFAAALGSALVAGVFFIFSVCIMQAFARIAPAGGMAAMQSINRAIINSWFLGAFFGTAALSVALITVAAMDWGAAGTAWALAGGLVYLASGIVVTMACNVPLNNSLDRVQPESAEGAKVWAHYLATWTKWNHVRAVGTLLAAAFFALARS